MNYGSPGLVVKDYPIEADKNDNNKNPSTGFGAGRCYSYGTKGCVIIVPIKDREDSGLGECCICFKNIHQLYALLPCGYTSVCIRCIGNIKFCCVCRITINGNMKIFK